MVEWVGKMIMPNYKAWFAHPDDFPRNSTQKEKLLFLIRFAILAPSSHNSQPWRFLVESNTIKVLPNKERGLPKSDPDNRQLYISLGCAIENILIAADYYGLHTTMQYLPLDDGTILTFSEGTVSSMEQKDHLVWPLLRRVTNRNPYTEKKAAQDFLENMRRHTREGITIEFIQEKEKKNQIAEVVIQAGIAAMEEEGFRNELSRYVKSNITRSKIGIPAFGMNIPTPVSLIVPFLLKYMNMNKVRRVPDRNLLTQNTPLFGMILTEKDTEEYWIKAGQLYEKIAISAEKEGLSTAVMAAPIEIGKFYTDIQKILSTPLRPQVFFRIGYAKAIPHHSPRLQAEEVTETLR